MADELISRQALRQQLEVTPLLTYGIPQEVRNGILDLTDKQPTVNAVVLPCKVGDILYSKDGKVVEVEELLIDKRGVYMTVSFKCDYNCEHCAFNTWRQEYSGEYSCEGEWGEMTIPADELGKTVFLTREEAEKALEGAKNE